MEKTEFNLKKVALLAAIPTPVSPVCSTTSWRFGFKYQATAETDRLLTAYDSGEPINISPKSVFDAYTLLLHRVRTLRAVGGVK